MATRKDDSLSSISMQLDGKNYSYWKTLFMESPCGVMFGIWFRQGGIYVLNQFKESTIAACSGDLSSFHLPSSSSACIWWCYKHLNIWHLIFRSFASLVFGIWTFRNFGFLHLVFESFAILAFGIWTFCNFDI